MSTTRNYADVIRQKMADDPDLADAVARETLDARLDVAIKLLDEIWPLIDASESFMASHREDWERRRAFVKGEGTV